MIFAAIFFNFLLWGYVVLRLRAGSDAVVLHYTIYFGIDRMGAWWQLYLMPLAGTLLIMGNGMLGWLFRRQDALPGLLLAGLALFAQFVLGLAAALVLA